MKKVANCFMSLGSVSRARAIFNGVMSKNSCRVVLIALVMLVCWNGSVLAQNKTIDDYLNDGDIVSLSITTGNTKYYLVPTAESGKSNRNPSISDNCLWVLHINKQTNHFTLQALGTQNFLYDNSSWQHKLIVTNTENNASAFSIAPSSGESGKQVTGKISYGDRNIQIGNQQSYGGQIFRTTSNSGNDVLIEKWTHVKIAGGIQFTVNPTSVSFTEFTDGTAENPVPQPKDVKITMKREQAQEYYENQNNTTQKITVTNATGSTELPKISSVSAAWGSNDNNNAFSSAKCQVYGSDGVSDRQLMQITSCTPTDDDKTECTVTVAAIGNSPMEMKTEDGKWKDHSDVLIVTFRDTEKDATYKARVNVTRHSFHAEELPEFEVTADQGSILFNKVGGNATVNITCTHQHGTKIWHKTYDHGDEEVSTSIKNIYSVARTTITNLSEIATFSPKSVSDQTNVDWITLSPSSTPGQAVSGSADGKLTLKAEANTKAIARSARLVGTFTYTCPDNDEITHTAFLQIPISQNAKDATIEFHHQKGHYNTEFGKNPHTLEDEQLVHTVERTIYYVPNQNISLNLQEYRFQGYKRWYDYETQDDPRYNADAADRTTWATAPQGNLIGTPDDYGDTYGVYDISARDANTPVIKGWANGAAHIIACDISNYKDYTFNPSTNNPEEITEPTLSYRQLFHLRPATEIAKKFADLETGEYLEEYTYMAPIDTDIYLSTEFRYNSATESDNCYFYYTDPVNKTGLTRVTDATWTGGGTTSGAFHIVSSNTPTPEGSAGTEYTLTANNGEVRIAKFTVKYVDKNTYGPTTTEIISRAEILSRYVLLEEVNFNFEPAPGTTNANKQLYHPLPWIESTYGYYYPNDVLGGNDKYHIHSNRSGNNIPYTGEYFLVNGLSLEWADQDNRGGAANGYVLYVDGSQEPGLVASISTSATICSGQTLYCSMWLCNPSRNRGSGSFADPIFRCNIQGRNAGDADWTDVGVYFVGDLPWGNSSNGGSWHQVNFPVVSEVNYDETRVQIYNFGTGESGNDFMVDDIRLYASPLPLAAYHATTGCQSYHEEETTNTVVVLRIDYDYLNEDLKGENKHVYYEVFNETDSVTVQLKEKVGDVYQPIYYQDDKSNVSPNFGSILIPPTRDGSGVPEKSDITSYINELTPQKGEKSKSGKCFVKDSGGKWFMYLVHVIPTGNALSGTDANVYLDRNKSYILRIAHQPGDLHKAACVFTTQLHATQDTYVQLHNDEVDSLRITSCMDSLCANNHHFLTVKVQNTIMPTVGGEMKTIEALVHADWLTGFEFDDAFCDESSATFSADTVKANKAFKDFYGYKRENIEDAIAAMRNTSPDNPNYEVDNAKNLQVLNGHLTEEQRSLIVDLCNKGLLLLYQKTKMFYLGSEATARYWVYPVAEDAEVTYEGQTYTLHDCNEPKWVKLTSVKSDYGVNLSPIKGEHQNEQQKLDVASIRILEGTKEVVIPVNELIKSTQLSSQLTANTNTIRFQYNDPTIKDVVQYVDLSKNRVDIIDPPATLEPGKDYLMRMAFYDEQGRPYINGDPTKCRVGYIYFYLSIVPKVVQWTGEASPIWGDDGNWKGVKEDGTLMDVGFAPLPETNVIIKPLGVDKPYPIVTEDDHYPMDVNHLPNACDKIYLASGTTIYNQHLLQYNRAFVDMEVPATAWNTMAAPMQGMYTGDMFIPHNTSDFSGKHLESDEPFVVSGFKGSRVSSSAPFAFWQSFYNKRVTIYHENGNTSSAMSSNTAAFAQTNSLSQKLEPGTGFQVLAYGPTNKNTEELIVRLPKPDTEYTYFNTDGSESWQKVSVEHSSKLAFTPSAGGEMVIDLKNATASNQFMFGNPTMTSIDMAKFIADNPAIKSYSTMVDGTWNAENKFTVVGASGLLAPMRSVLLNLEDGNTKTSLQLVLKTSHLVGYTDYNTPSEEPETIAPRKNSAEAGDETMLMTVYATSNKGQARCMVVANGGAKDTYDSNEDVLFFSSGVEEGVNSATATSPVNMYTVSEQVPMMVDVREKIDTVPLSMLVHKSYRTEKVKFSFYLSLNWDKECYFCDAVTGERYRILDGLVLEMDMPQNHEVRYFIDGPDEIDPDGGGDIWSSTEDVKTSTNQVWAYSPSQGQLVVASNDIIKAVMVYDIAGRLIGYRELEMQYNSTTFDTPTGACIVKAVLRDNTEHYISALVK